VPTPTISVVIAALNERRQIERALHSTRATGVERIVVDGGSIDGTPEIALMQGAEHVLVSQPGRARQMDAGYRRAQGEIVLFLHADTRLEEGWADAVRDALADPAVSGGAFRLRFESWNPVYRLIEGGARTRCRIARLPYGDQALFVRRKVLDEQDGLPDTPIFEDLDLARAVRRSGRLALLRLPAWTSPRRYERNGPLTTMFRNWIALTAYALGLDRQRVARWYRRRPDA
jgi:rSAM/selenodomain-associated transferase 2